MVLKVMFMQIDIIADIPIKRTIQTRLNQRLSVLMGDEYE